MIIERQWYSGSTAPFQGVDPGSTPGQRISLLCYLLALNLLIYCIIGGQVIFTTPMSSYTKFIESTNQKQQPLGYQAMRCFNLVSESLHKESLQLCALDTPIQNIEIIASQMLIRGVQSIWSKEEFVQKFSQYIANDISQQYIELNMDRKMKPEEQFLLSSLTKLLSDGIFKQRIDVKSAMVSGIEGACQNYLERALSLLYQRFSK
ncbi:Hypothetical_protein [Hexamita inflata]|uniref:Hypothetical_protein n=1 Tax=Hexamita inflata TaxID=28002 RepID=A0AA86S1I1_9EUKA|nr:Hypothetical protein HINF_LOCUS64030 [Hexamita inflata]